MNIQPLHDKLFVILDEAEATTSSGIIIPDNAKEKPRRGKIVAIGTDEDMDIFTVGDTILFGKYAGDDLTHDGVDYIVVCRNDVLALLK